MNSETYNIFEDLIQKESEPKQAIALDNITYRDTKRLTTALRSCVEKTCNNN